MTIKRFPVTALLLILAAGMLLGQTQSRTGTIAGIVTDSSGAAIPNATVTVRNTGTGVERQIQTDGEGRFQAPLLDPGMYSVTTKANGFGTLVSRGYELTLGQTIAANQELKVATASETLTVEAAAPVVETTNSQTGALVNSALVANLPLNGRRFLDLAQLTPGMMVEPERNQISFAGSRGINSGINIDGANFNEPFFGGQAGGERAGSAYVVSQAAIDQFQVVRGAFDAEYGRTTGGSVNVITKSGTNDFHGEVFDYQRFANASPKTVFGDRVTDQRNQFGGAVGGRIIRDRMFFFTTYDGQRQHQPLNIRFNGDLTGLPQSYISQQGVFESTNDVNTFLAKVNYQMTPRHSLTLRYNQSGNVALNGTFSGGVQTGVLSNNGTEKDFNRGGVANLTSSLRPDLLNEFRFQYRIEDRPRVNNLEDMDFVNKAGPQTQITGCCYFGGVSYLPIPVTTNTTQIANAATWIRGAHTIKFGAEVNRYGYQETFRGNWRGVYIFNKLTDFLNVLNKVPGAAPDTFRIFYGQGKFDERMLNPAAFIQDAWKVSKRVTLSLGLRYDATIMPQPPQPNPALPYTSKVPNDSKQFQPRVGLAVDLTGDGKTVLRGGAGLFYASTPGLLLFQAFNSNGNPNVGVSFNLNKSQILGVQAVHPEFVYPFVPASSNAADSTYFSNSGVAGVKGSASFFAPDYRSPRSLNFTLGVERQISTGMSAAIDWVHSNTVHLERIRDVNLWAPVLGEDTAKQIRPLYDVSKRPNSAYGALLSQESSARSNYDGLTLSLKRRMTNHWQFDINGTLAWNRDDDSNERNYSGITYQDAYNLAQEYSWSRLDIRRRLVASTLYELPLGFQISGLMTWRSGLPFSAFVGSDLNKDGNTTDRPIINGVLLPRNSFRQPNWWGTDLRVTKKIRIAERQRVEVMVDFFNAFNHENFTYPASGSEGSAANGSRWGTGQTPLSTFRNLYDSTGAPNKSSASVGSPIQLQFSARYVF